MAQTAVVLGILGGICLFENKCCCFDTNYVLLLGDT